MIPKLLAFLWLLGILCAATLGLGVLVSVLALAKTSMSRVLVCFGYLAIVAAAATWLS
jgi:hypothetical protein